MWVTKSVKSSYGKYVINVEQRYCAMFFYEFALKKELLDGKGSGEEMKVIKTKTDKFIYIYGDNGDEGDQRG